MPNTSQIGDILFKKGLGLGTTQSGRSFFEEPIQGRVFVVPNQIWQQAELIPNTAPASTSGIVQKVDDYNLVQVLGATNSFSGALLVDAIPFNWGDGTSYNYTVKDSTNASIAFGVNDWVIDTEAGILMFNNGIPSNMPPKVSFYRYSGEKGLGGGGAGDVVSINGITGFIQITGSGNVEVQADGTIFRIGGTFVTPDQTGFFATKDEVSAASAGVSSINSTSGVLTFVGSDGISISTDAGTFTFSGSQSAIASLSGDLLQTGLDLFNRDVGLSANLASLSGSVVFSSETGGLLDPTDLNYLEARDTGLSVNLVTLSGNLGTTGQALWLRDKGLSDSIVALSGQSLPASATGIFLTASDSGNLVSKNETGQFASDLDITNVTNKFNNSGLDLFNRDLNLSNNVSLISGNVVTNTNNLGSTGQTLWLRDVGLSNGISTLSGQVVFLSDTGQFASDLDVSLQANRIISLSGSLNSTGIYLFNRINSLSGNVVLQTNRITSLSGSLNDTGLTLYNRDLGLSSNIAALSGSVVPSSSTGLFLTQSDSGNFVSKSETGQFASDVDISNVASNLGLSGETLWIRDAGLSANIAALSGSIPAPIVTGGFLDHASGKILWDRDTNLSSNISTLSGSVSLQINRITSLSGSLNESGSLLWLRDSALSDGLIALSGAVAAASAGVSSINGQSGLLTFVGANGITITVTDGDTFTFSGEHSVIESLSGNLVASGATFNQTGLNLWNRDSVLSSILALVSGNVTTEKNRINSLTGSLDSTGSLLWIRDTNLSLNVASLSGSINSTGLDLFNRDLGLSLSIADLSGTIPAAITTGGFLDHASGKILWDRDIGLSTNLSIISGNVVFKTQTGGFLDLTDQTALETRDSNLSSNVSLLSGNVSLNTNKITSLTGSLNSSGSLLWIRDVGLSASIADLSGTIPAAINTGLFLTQSDSGNFVLKSQTGGFLDLASLSLLQSRDTELSNNVATLSGAIVFTNQTGGLLDLSDQTNLELRDTNLSANVASISGNITTQTNRISSLTGSLNTSGSLLWLRDQGLSDSIIALSGTIPGVINTGGLLDHASGKILWDRDAGLSSSISALSGAAVLDAETGTFLTQGDSGNIISRLGSTGQTLWTRDTALSSNVAALSGTVTTQTNRITSLTGSMNTTGLALFNRDLQLSNNVASISGNIGTTGQTLWLRDVGLSASIAALSGIIPAAIVTGGFLDHASGKILWDREAGLVSNITDLSGNVVFKTETGGFLDLASQTALELRDTNLSSNVAALSGLVVFSSETGDFLDPTDTVYLEGRDDALGSNVALLSGYVGQTGFDLFNRDLILSDNLALVSGQGGWDHASGTLLWNRDFQLSETLAIISGVAYAGDANASAFKTTLSNGIQTEFVPFPTNSTSSPAVIVTIEESGTDNIPSFKISGVSTSGYWINLSAPTDSDFYVVHTVVNLSGVNQLAGTGGLLDLSDLAYLESRDLGLSDNLALVSGQGGWNHASGALLWNRDGSLSGSMNQTGLDLWNRDIGLSTNIATLSGNVVFSSQTGTFLTQGDSGNIISRLGTTGQTLWLRDSALSSNVASLSGTVTTQTNRITSLSGSMNTTGLSLFNRDLQLSNNIASLSGTVTTQTNRVTSLSGSMNSTGLNLWNRDAGLSASIVALSGIMGSSSVVTNVWDSPKTLTDTNNNQSILLSSATLTTGTLPNGLTSGFSIGFSNISDQDWAITGYVIRDLNNNIISEYVLSKGDYAAFTLESGNYWRVFSDSKTFVESSQTGGFLDHASGTLLFDRDSELGNAIATNSGFIDTLFSQDDELSANLALVSGLAGGWDHASGTLLWDRDLSLSGSMDSTGLDLWNRDVSLSGYHGGLISNNYNQITFNYNRTTSLSGSLDATGLALWNRDLQLSNNLAAVSGLAGGGFPDASGFYLRNRSNHTGTQPSESISQTVDYWTTPETLTNAYNSRYIILSAAGLSYTALPDNLSGGMTAHFANVNIGEWVFTGSNLRNLNDENLTGYALNKGEMATFILESGAGFGSTYWRALASNETGFYLDYYSGTLLWNRDLSLSGNMNSTGLSLWNRDLQLSNNVATLSGTLTTQTNRITSLTGSMDSTGLSLWNRDLSLSGRMNAQDLGLSDNLALVSGLAVGGGLPEASGILLWNRDASLTGSMNSTGLSLFNRDLQLSSNVASLSGNLITSGSYIDNRIISLSGRHESITLGVRDSSAAVITATEKGRVIVGNAGSIVGWKLISKESTTMTLDLWKANGSNPSNANSITAASKPSLTAASYNSDTTLAGWTTSLAAGDIIVLEVESNSASSDFNLRLDVVY